VARALTGVAVSSPYYYDAVQGYVSDWHTLGTIRDHEQSVIRTQLALGNARARLLADLVVSTRRRAKSATRVKTLGRQLVKLAVGEFMSDGPVDDQVALLDPQRAGDTVVQIALVDTVNKARTVDLQVNQSIVDATTAAVASDRASLADVRDRQQVAARDLAAARSDEARALAAVANDRTKVTDTRLTARVSGTDLTLVALNAYWKAATTMAAFGPSCRLSWTALAGIGRVESQHGSYAGDSLDPNGEETRPMIGIPLDGKTGTVRVPDTDQGSLDHDTTYDRAVGPMQLLPSAWRTYGRDGNGDGRVDPQNMYDAALAAAVMLCRYGALDTDAGLRTTFFHYNASNAYVAEVLGDTHEYATFVIPRVA
jgi:membrane-bound lytic murein transglycosylase B